MAKMSKASEVELATCKPELVAVIQAAVASFDGADVIVTDGRRTIAEQRLLVAKGASHTLNSNHIPKPPETLSRAVDLCFKVGKKARYDWPLYFQFADHVRMAARVRGVKVRWGAMWNRILNDIDGDLDDALADYVADFRKQHGRSPFIDGPHFELV